MLCLLPNLAGYQFFFFFFPPDYTYKNDAKTIVLWILLFIPQSTKCKSGIWHKSRLQMFQQQPRASGTWLLDFLSANMPDDFLERSPIREIHSSSFFYRLNASATLLALINTTPNNHGFSTLLNEKKKKKALEQYDGKEYPSFLILQSL